MATNPFLTGNFAPVRDELNASDLPVEGALPPDLEGMLMRIGPNPIKPAPDSYEWFLGDGMVHAVELGGGRAISYRNRWVRTSHASSLLGEEPPGGPPDLIPEEFAVANTNVIEHCGHVLALVETALPTEIDRDLRTLGRYDFAGRLRSAMTAHPKADRVTGELLFLGYDPFGPPYLRFYTADSQGQLAMSRDIEIPAPTMMHDFAITERYVVFLDLPVVVDYERLQRGGLPVEWRPSYGARVGLMPRAGGDVRWTEIEPCYVFHTLNAYDDGDRVIVDVVRYPSMFGGEAAPARLERWEIDAVSGKVTTDCLDDRGQEFPRIDDRLTGRPHRYGYATQSPRRPGKFGFGGLVKHDLRTGVTQVNDLGPGHAASEPVFAPGGCGEEDGWLLSLVYDAANDASDLVVLDARDFTAPPVARVRMPQRVPFGFHGSWLPSTGQES